MQSIRDPNSNSLIWIIAGAILVFLFIFRSLGGGDTETKQKYALAYESCQNGKWGDNRYCKEFADSFAASVSSPTRKSKTDRQTIEEAAGRLEAYCKGNPGEC